MSYFAKQSRTSPQFVLLSFNLIKMFVWRPVATLFKTKIQVWTAGINHKVPLICLISKKSSSSEFLLVFNTTLCIESDEVWGLWHTNDRKEKQVFISGCYFLHPTCRYFITKALKNESNLTWKHHATHRIPTKRSPVGVAGSQYRQKDKDRQTWPG